MSFHDWFREDGTIERSKIPDDLDSTMKTDLCYIAANQWKVEEAKTRIAIWLREHGFAKYLSDEL